MVENYIVLAVIAGIVFPTILILITIYSVKKQGLSFKEEFRKSMKKNMNEYKGRKKIWWSKLILFLVLNLITFGMFSIDSDFWKRED